jgi:hypothetical protein
VAANACISRLLCLGSMRIAFAGAFCCSLDRHTLSITYICKQYALPISVFYTGEGGC